MCASCFIPLQGFDQGGSTVKEMGPYFIYEKSTQLSSESSPTPDSASKALLTGTRPFRIGIPPTANY